MLLVIGDFIVDQTYLVTNPKASPEAPSLSIDLTSREPIWSPGGAGFAAAYAKKAGFEVHLATILSFSAKEHLWAEYKVEADSLADSVSFNDLAKTRFIDICSGYHLLRLNSDLLATKPDISPQQMVKKLDRIIKEIHPSAYLLSDYTKGLFKKEYDWSYLLNYLSELGVPILLDSRAINLSHWFKDGKLNPKVWLKLNEKEANNATRVLLNQDNPTELVYMDDPIVSKLIVTRGSKGAYVAIGGGIKGTDTIDDFMPTVRSSKRPDVTG